MKKRTQEELKRSKEEEKKEVYLRSSVQQQLEDDGEQEKRCDRQILTIEEIVKGRGVGAKRLRGEEESGSNKF